MGDPTLVICQIQGCQAKISRGKTGSDRSRLSNTGMSTHLESTQKKECGEYLIKKREREGLKAAEDEQLAEEDETEDLGVPIFNLRTQKKRKSFFQQNLPGMLESHMTYDVNDPRAKAKHKGILTMIVTDLKPFSIVNDPGFLNYSKLLDPRFAVGSDMFYRRLLDKAFILDKEKVQKRIQEADPGAVSIQPHG